MEKWFFVVGLKRKKEIRGVFCEGVLMRGAQSILLGGFEIRGGQTILLGSFDQGRTEYFAREF